jgi:hypothetical protein
MVRGKKLEVVKISHVRTRVLFGLCTFFCRLLFSDEGLQSRNEGRIANYHAAGLRLISTIHTSRIEHDRACDDRSAPVSPIPYYAHVLSSALHDYVEGASGGEDFMEEERAIDRGRAGEGEGRVNRKGEENVICGENSPKRHAHDHE